MRIQIIISLLIVIGCQRIDPPDHKIILLGHGGSGFDNMSGNYAPNSVGSFNEAMFHYGLDGVEVDIVFTKDGKLLVFHDNFLESATNCKGKINTIKLDDAIGCKYRDQFYNSYNQEVISYDSLTWLINNRWTDKIVSLNIRSNWEIGLKLDSIAGLFARELDKIDHTAHITLECDDANFFYFLRNRRTDYKCMLVNDIDTTALKDVLRFRLDGLVSTFDHRDREIEKMLLDSSKSIWLYGFKSSRHYSKTDFNGIEAIQVDNPIRAIKYFRED